MQSGDRLPDWYLNDLPIGFVHMPRRKFFTKKRRDTLSRTWGYFLIPAIFWLWTARQLSYGPIAIISTLASLFFLFQARMPCGAQNRAEGEYCLNNARGLLGGCNQVVAHKRYKGRMLMRHSTWGRFMRSAWVKFEGRAVTLAAMATCLSTLVAMGALAIASFTWLDPRVPR